MVSAAEGAAVSGGEASVVEGAAASATVEASEIVEGLVTVEASQEEEVAVADTAVAVEASDTRVALSPLKVRHPDLVADSAVVVEAEASAAAVVVVVEDLRTVEVIPMGMVVAIDVAVEVEDMATVHLATSTILGLATRIAIANLSLARDRMTVAAAAAAVDMTTLANRDATDRSCLTWFGLDHRNAASLRLPGLLVEALSAHSAACRLHHSDLPTTTAITRGLELTEMRRAC